MKNGFTHILLADNNEEERNFFKGALENLKMKTIVQTVNNGDELLQYLSSPNAESPHIVFLDQKLQSSASSEYLQLLKSLNSTKDTAIAIYATNATAIDIEKSFVDGANVYIKKPSDFQLFKKKLENILALNWHYLSSGLNRDNFILSL